MMFSAVSIAVFPRLVDASRLGTVVLARQIMAAADESWKDASSIYDFAAVDIDGNEVSFDKYKGHVALIVNVASK